MLAAGVRWKPSSKADWLEPEDIQACLLLMIDEGLELRQKVIA
jgi:hypothetical protein